MKESKKERFARLATARTNKATKNIELIGNLANKSNYDYDEESVTKIFDFLEAKVREARMKFETPERKRFSLSDENGRICLEPEVYNALNRLSHMTKTDCWFSIRTDSDGYDVIYDIEEKKRLPLKKALELLFEAVMVNPIQAYDLNEDEICSLVTLVSTLDLGYIAEYLMPEEEK